LRAQPRFDLGHDFILRPAFARGLAKDHVGFVGSLRRFAHAVEFGRCLVHEYVVHEQRAVFERDVRVLDEREGTNASGAAATRTVPRALSRRRRRGRSAG